MLCLTASAGHGRAERQSELAAMLCLTASAGGFARRIARAHHFLRLPGISRAKIDLHRDVSVNRRLTWDRAYTITPA
jgi:hypothetical protein